MLVYNLTYYYYTIALQDLSFLEDQTTDSNMAACCQDTTIKTALASY